MVSEIVFFVRQIEVEALSIFIEERWLHPLEVAAFQPLSRLHIVYYKMFQKYGLKMWLWAIFYV